MANAIRFGQIEFGKGNLPAGETEIIKAVREAFLPNDFPWIYDQKGMPAEDVRFEGVDFEHLGFIRMTDGNIVRENISQPTEGRKQPTVILVDGEKSATKRAILAERKLVSEQSNGKPFVIVLKKEGDLTVIHLICNHEIMDGVPSAYYVRKIRKNLGLEKYNLADVDPSFLRKVLDEADRREATEGDYHRVKSKALGKELTRQIVDLYEKIRQNLGQYQIELSFETFIQLFLLDRVNGQTIKGATLRFFREKSKELDLYALGDIYGLMRAMISGDINALSGRYKDYIVKNKEGRGRVGLFRKNQDIINRLIGQVTRSLPEATWTPLNNFSKEAQAALAASGQMMVSLIPDKIVYKGADGEKKEAPLGFGFGGPACTEYQEAAFTVSLVKDTDGRIVNILIRRKYAEEFGKRRKAS